MLSKTTYPPNPPVISVVAFSIFRLISSDAASAVCCTARDASIWFLAVVPERVDTLPPRLILLLSGSEMLISAS